MKKYTQVEFTAASLRMSSPSVAGYAYEVFAQRTFSHGTEPIAISWFNSTSQLVTRPTASSSFDSEGHSTVEANTLYYPTTPDFPSLNYFFVTDCGQAVMLHVTVRTMHTNEDNGIKKVLGYIQSNTSSPPHTFSFVYIVPFPSSGQKLVSQFEGGERIVSGQTLRVGYTTLQFGNKADGLLKKMIEEESGDTNTDNWRDGV
ncbi:hypothetical protein FRB94_007880 [Tulasnella sp. JGI-2019a]|nr:hypothetical protein FRB94_007880 [Tulasnella sp. JGI-2019a]